MFVARRRARKAPRRSVVVRRSAPIVRTRTRYVRVRRAGRAVASGAAKRKEKIGVAIASAAWGYFKAKNPTMLAQVPSVAGFGKELTVGIALAWFVKPARGGWMDHLTTSLLAIGAYNWGNAQATGAALQGDDDDLSGEMD